MKKFPWFTVLVYSALGVCFGAFFIGLVMALQGNKVVGTAEVAAWAQALASVAALVAAIGIAQHQSTLQRRAKRDQELRDAMQLSRLASLAAKRALPAVEHFAKATSTWPIGIGFIYRPYEIDESKSLIDMAVAKIVHPDLIEPLVNIHRTLGAIQQACRDLQGVENTADQSRVKVFNELWLIQLRENVANIEEVAAVAAQQLARFENRGL